MSFSLLLDAFYDRHCPDFPVLFFPSYSPSFLEFHMKDPKSNPVVIFQFLDLSNAARSTPQTVRLFDLAAFVNKFVPEDERTKCCILILAEYPAGSSKLSVSDLSTSPMLTAAAFLKAFEALGVPYPEVPESDSSVTVEKVQ